jgi:amidase
MNGPKHLPGVRRFGRLGRFFAPAAGLAILSLGWGAPARAADSGAAFHVEEATIADIQEAILAKRLTATELVKLYLARIKAYNGPDVEEPQGILGPIKPIRNSRQVDALITLNLRPATRRALGFDER